MPEVSTERAKLGYGLAEDEGEAFWLFGMLETIKIGRDDTAGPTAWSRSSPPRGSDRPGMSIATRTSGSTSSRAS
jgi:hypothetical protein